VRAVDVIAAKRDGEEIPDGALREFVLGYARDEVADYQMAAFLMAGFLNGFSHAEAVALTAAMVASGDELDLSALSGPTVDKHSTGGVGDGTTLVVAPLAAELGMQVVKLSGRGLGHTGGTLDKLDAIPGMRTELSGDELIAQVEAIGLAVCAQTADLVPADKAMYALRDVTATVDNVALIASSVMSKKLAGGAQAILLDVKVGSGAFMKDPAHARELAELCVGLGEAGGRATGALITDMDQPLADAVGNATEVREAIEVLRGEREGRFSDLCVSLVGHMAALTGRAADAEDGITRARGALGSGAALERFRRFVEAQGGDPRIVEDPGLLPQAPLTHEVRAEDGGRLAAVDAEAIGRAAAGVGAGRRRKEDEIDLAVGIDFLASIGDEVEAGGIVARVLANDDATAEAAGREILAALEWSQAPVDPPPLVHAVIGERLGGT
jgi:pyrimidine-nucleoside phosphorylase